MGQLLAGVDLAATATGVGAIGAVATLIWKGLKKGFRDIRDGAAESTPKIVGGTIMSSVEMTMLSERLREAAEATRDATPVLAEVAHQAERLRDELARR